MAEAANPAGAWEFWIDVGGTFTDCIARRPDGTIAVHKLLSTGVYKGTVGAGSSAACIVDPQRVGEPAGFFRGWRIVLGGDTEGSAAHAAGVREYDSATGRFWLEHALPRTPKRGMRYELHSDEEAPLIGIRRLMGKRLDEPIGAVRVKLGTTRGTNALLERKGAATAFVTTKGLGDVLRIGYQTRPKLFDLHIRKPEPLYSHVLEIDERIDARGNVLRPLTEASVGAGLEELRQAGVESLAVCLMNSYRNCVHERTVESLAREAGFENVSVSSRLSPLQGLIPRGETTVIDAYLTPILRDYVAGIVRRIPAGSLKLMTSAGALVDANSFVAKDSILSGPAAGVVGCAHVARLAGFEKAIGFDMGGTSTDVSRYDGVFERRYEMQIEDRATGGATHLVGDMLAIETVAAGGGSICDFDGIKPTVGPRSAGADPGPACYGRGGPLCLTDVNFILGRIPAAHFPFPLDGAAAENRLDGLIGDIERATGRRYEREELAAGYVSIANTHMAAAIKKISIARGYDPREYVLVSFGGAGGQHACAIARELGISRILLHPYAGVLSAYGAGVADVTRFAARDVGRPCDPETLAALDLEFAELELSLRKQVCDEGVDPEDILPPRRLLDLRYAGQESTITVERPANGDWRGAFERMHRQLYGFTLSERDVQVFAARVELTGRTRKPETLENKPIERRPRPCEHAEVYFAGRRRATPIFRRDDLHAGARVDGPAIVIEATGTLVIEPNWSAEVTARGDVLLVDGSRGGESAELTSTQVDPVTLELFNNHFAAIAEQMGATLQKTALSTNVKERLDFSCAIYDSDGGLVANAPHIPVHLGAMGQCVKCLIEDTHRDDDRPGMRPGDVFVTNHPYRGGSHLPDVTVVTPVFDDAGHSILFFAASRAHHAEIGGVSPGSMPPHSKNLSEEGVVIRTMRLVETGGASDRMVRERELHHVLTDGPYPSRAPDQNIADIHAQAAANERGVMLLGAMIGHFGGPAVQAYMGHIQRAAETKMRAALRKLPDGEHAFTDVLDDGTPIAVRIDVRGDRAVVDFSGTGPVLPGNLNATPAIVASAVLYCFRCLIDEEIPLNAGVLAPIEIVLPECLLSPPLHDDPARCAAVVGGNVETSQRIADAIFGALGVVAAGQGTMNNVVFGNERFGYYETIGGGAGAGPGFDGASAVHVNMTNTRLTDPEILEDRYPVRLRRFAIRSGSGGAGRWRGGDGIVREIEFLEPVEVSLITQRRTKQPFGLAGGEAGLSGRNQIRKASGELIRLGPLAGVRVESGDVLCVETPGGGGFGRAHDNTWSSPA